MEYTFTLKYQLADDDRDMEALVERLGEAGCDDALVGIGQPGRLALEFTREAESAEAAVRSALADVRCAVVSAKFIEAAPGLVGLTDVAGIVGVSRQYMRKLMLAHPGSFPRPVHEGRASLWHLADVLLWLQGRGGYALQQDVLEVAQVALQGPGTDAIRPCPCHEGKGEEHCRGRSRGHAGVSGDTVAVIG